MEIELVNDLRYYIYDVVPCVQLALSLLKRGFPKSKILHVLDYEWCPLIVKSAVKNVPKSKLYDVLRGFIVAVLSHEYFGKLARRIAIEKGYSGGKKIVLYRLFRVWSPYYKRDVPCGVVAIFYKRYIRVDFDCAREEYAGSSSIGEVARSQVAYRLVEVGVEG